MERIGTGWSQSNIDWESSQAGMELPAAGKELPASWELRSIPEQYWSLDHELPELQWILVGKPEQQLLVLELDWLVMRLLVYRSAIWNCGWVLQLATVGCMRCPTICGNSQFSGAVSQASASGMARNGRATFVCNGICNRCQQWGWSLTFGNESNGVPVSGLLEITLSKLTNWDGMLFSSVPRDGRPGRFPGMIRSTPDLAVEQVT